MRSYAPAVGSPTKLARVHSSAVRSHTDSRRGRRRTVDLRGRHWARIQPCKASHFHLASTVQPDVAGSYEGRLISTVQNSSPKLAIRRLSRCLDPALMSAAPHYGLRYGSVPATGNFQRLRGRSPLVSPLKSCMRRSFTAVTRVQIPSGTPNLINELRGFPQKLAVQRRYNLVSSGSFLLPCFAPLASAD
jgi:hypothetical protein